MTAREAIQKATEKKSQVIFGRKAQATPSVVRDELQRMAEQREISPRTYWKALKVSWADLVCNGEKAWEFAELIK